MIYSDDKKSIIIRYRFVLIALCFFFLILFARMLQLTLFDRSFLEQQGNARAIRVLSLPAYRGMVTDRLGKPLAVSVPIYSIWVNPQQFSLKDPHISKLSKLLDMPKSKLSKSIDRHNKKEFLYLKRQVEPSLAKQILALKIPGLHAIQSYKRYYPQGAVMAPVIGFTNIDEQGQEGLELEYNSWLKGTAGKEVVVKDLYGHVVKVNGVIKQAQPGKDLMLSIDSSIQYQAYNALKKAVQTNNANSASMVILDVKTGEILAMANYPSYNPNIRPRKRSTNFKNRAVTDVFEPGSTIKTFAVMNALQSGKYQPNTMIDTSPGWFYLNGKRVGDEINHGKINITTILQVSSNVGVTKLTLSLAPDSLWQLLHNMGFGSVTDTMFPGEASGDLQYHDRWSQIGLATMSFGYGISVTTLQLARAYATVADYGIKKPVTLLKTQNTNVGQQVVKAKIAGEVITMLESVVARKGTGTLAEIPGYKVAGKTGTVRLLGPHGYDKTRHNGIFVGMVPASSPKYVAAVIVRDPKKLYYGGSIAAPVFSEVMASVLREYNIPPDNMTSKQGAVS